MKLKKQATMKIKKTVKNEPRARKGMFPFLAFLLFFAGIVFALSSELEEIIILSQSPNPIAFIGFVILAAIIVTFSIGYIHWKPKKTDGSINSLFFATSLLLLVVIAKSFAGNYWNSYSISYLFLPPALIVGAVIIYNLDVLKKVILPSMYALLAWPFILIKGHALFAEPLIQATSYLTLLLSKLTLVPLTEIDPVNNVLQLESTGFVASIGVACSGTSSIFATIILTLPLLFFLKGSAIKKILWILFGVIFAFFGNVLRTYLIFFAAHFFSTDLALNIFHSSGGMTIFIIIFALELFALRLFKLKLTIPKIQVIDSKTSFLLIKRTLLFVSFMIVFAFIDIPKINTQPPTQIAPQKISTEEPVTKKTSRDEDTAIQENILKSKESILEDVPKQPEKEFNLETLNRNTSRRFLITKNEPFSLVPPLGGYDITTKPFDFAKQLFGQDAEYYRFKYKLDDNPTFFTDVIITDDKNSLLGLSSRYCYRYHNYEILHEETIQIKSDVIATFHSYIDNTGLNWESIDFITPVIEESTGKQYYRKVRIIREVRYDIGEDFNSTREKIELFTYQLFDSLFYSTSN